MGSELLAGGTARRSLRQELVHRLIDCFFAIATIGSTRRRISSGSSLRSSRSCTWAKACCSGSASARRRRATRNVAAFLRGHAAGASSRAEQLAAVPESLAIRTENLSLLEQLAKETVERALDEARLASESKSRFLAAASHDLRQPLHALTMFLGTLTFHVTTDDAKRLLGRIKETTDVLRTSSTVCSTCRKFDAGAVQPDLSSFDLAALSAS